MGAMSLVVLAACSSGNLGSPPSGTSGPAGAPLATSSPTTSLSAGDKANNEALAAYLGMWKDFAIAGVTSDWQSTGLVRHATGIALTNLTRGLYADRYNGLVTKGEATHDAKVMSAEPADKPTKIIVTDCSDSTKALKHRADNGQLADDTPGGRRLINGQVEPQADGSWKVTDFAVHEVGSC
ncbi:hypothetical protein SAMN04487818_11180 [Actinokineospora terrae]|uniref:Mce-associated membrane protein n=1 Tax=Actinokineospora terrae TaxID=155974 RepID=A0A1H9WQI4_9PSEU|nr:hypothetical protein SAMN04487818_11180 [Actinokineospora terrae]